jgi:hypothetical protein
MLYVRSDARWSHATLPELSSHNSAHLHTLQNDLDLGKRGWVCCEYMHHESELVLSPDSFKLLGDNGNSVSAEKHRLKIGCYVRSLEEFFQSLSVG